MSESFSSSGLGTFSLQSFLAQRAADVSDQQISRSLLEIKLRSRTPYENTSCAVDHPPVEEVKYQQANQNFVKTINEVRNRKGAKKMKC